MQALIFDLVGTLVDTIDLIVASFRDVIEDLTGRTYTRQEIIDLFGPTEPVIIDRFAGTEQRKTAHERFFAHYQQNHDRLVKLFPGIPELIQKAAQRGHPLALVTNKGRRTTAITLEKSGLAAYFKVVITGEDVGRPKPDPEGIRLALTRLGAEISEAWFVGDSSVDVLPGRAAGTRTCAVGWGGVHPPEEALAYKPDAFCRETADLHHLLWG